jgi:hypothetical protein
MDIHSRNVLRGFEGASVGSHSAIFRFGEKPTNGMKQKCSGTTSRIENPLLKGAVNRVAHNLSRNPVGSVVLAKSMALGAIDQGFVQDLENVTLDLGQSKAANVSHDSENQLFARRIRNYPIEEIAFDRALNTCRFERFA